MISTNNLFILIVTISLVGILFYLKAINDSIKTLLAMLMPQVLEFSLSEDEMQEIKDGIRKELLKKHDEQQ